MRRRTHEAEIEAEPNLVPLLDLTFQLIMFFMICVNFVSEQVNEDIKLPVSQSARAMDKGQVEVLILNMDVSGDITLVGQEKMTTPRLKQYILKQYFVDYRHAAEAGGKKESQIKTTVILRAHRDCMYSQIFELVGLVKQIAKDAKVPVQIQVAAYSKTGGV